MAAVSLLLSVAAVIVVIVVIFKFEKLQNSFMILVALPYFESIFDKTFCAKKKALFSILHHVKSQDNVLQSKGAVRILEIGIGLGINFDFYPDGTHLIAMDIDTGLEGPLRKRLQNYPEIVLEKLIFCDAAKMTEISDNSVDVVVATMTLCSVSSVSDTLREVHRILVPGGYFLELDHNIAHESYKFYRLIQNVLRLPWKFLFKGCDLTRDLKLEAIKAGFDKVDIDDSIVTEMPWILKPILTHSFACVATKRR